MTQLANRVRITRAVQVTAQWHDDDWYTTGGASAAGGRRQNGAEVGLARPLVGSVLDSNGLEQFGITESVTPTAGGGFTVTLTVAFDPPTLAAASGANIPLVSLSPTVNTTGGTITQDQTLYYALSALDGNRAESGLSFVVRAVIPSGVNTNSVELTGMSFSSGTAGFNVYRGPNPLELLRIANNVSGGGDIYRYWRGLDFEWAAGCELRSCEFLLAAGIAAGGFCRDSIRHDGREQHTGDAGE